MDQEKELNKLALHLDNLEEELNGVLGDLCSILGSLKSVNYRISVFFETKE